MNYCTLTPALSLEGRGSLEGRIGEPSPLWGEGRVRGARSLRTRQTDTEQRLWTRLRDRRLLGFKFRRQHPIGRYIVDFCCAEAKLVIELDGGQHANDRVHDAERTAMLKRDGYRVIRFWDNDVFQNLEGVLVRIAEALKTPHPSPLPKGERENQTPSPRPSPQRGEGESDPSPRPSPQRGEGAEEVLT
jgi:very-short-patch-repair endonuclease